MKHTQAKVQEQRQEKHCQAWEWQFEWEALVLTEPEFALNPKTSDTRTDEATMYTSEIAWLDQLEQQ